LSKLKILLGHERADDIATGRAEGIAGFKRLGIGNAAVRAAAKPGNDSGTAATLLRPARRHRPDIGQSVGDPLAMALKKGACFLAAICAPMAA